MIGCTTLLCWSDLCLVESLPFFQMTSLLCINTLKLPHTWYTKRNKKNTSRRGTCNMSQVKQADWWLWKSKFPALSSHPVRIDASCWVSSDSIMILTHSHCKKTGYALRNKKHCTLDSVFIYICFHSRCTSRFLTNLGLFTSGVSIAFAKLFWKSSHTLQIASLTCSSYITK